MPQLHRRAVAVAAVASAFALGGTGAAVASADTPATYPSAPSGPTAPGTMPGHAMFGGLFHALFDVFGAVRTQAPTIAAPVIADGVTAGTITQPEADQLTAMFASLGTPPAAPSAPATGGTPATPGTHTRPSFSPGQRTVLHAVAEAIRTQLVTIATPVLDADVTAGTITAQQETMILGVLGHLAAPHAAPAATPPASAPVDPAAALQQAATHKVVAKALKAHRHASRKSTRKAATRR